MARTHYALWYCLDGLDAYLIWHSDDWEEAWDGVVLVSGEDGEGDEHRRLPTFSSISALRAWAESQSLEIAAEEPILHDLDSLQNWLRSPTSDPLDPDVLLAGWNLFIDIQASIERRDVLRQDKDNDGLYSKLFWATNPPSLTPSGERFEPAWTDEERNRLQRILAEGLRRFRALIISFDKV